MAVLDRRAFLTGIAVAATVPPAAAFALPKDDELGKLIEAHKSAYATLEEACGRADDLDCYATEIKTEVAIEEAALAQRICDAACAAETSILHSLLRYRPRSLEEVRERAEYLLIHAHWLEGGASEEEIAALLRSEAAPA